MSVSLHLYCTKDLMYCVQLDITYYKNIYTFTDCHIYADNSAFNAWVSLCQSHMKTSTLRNWSWNWKVCLSTGFDSRACILPCHSLVVIQPDGLMSPMQCLAELLDLELERTVDMTLGIVSSICYLGREVVRSGANDSVTVVAGVSMINCCKVVW
jgi:hypothetical protein